MSYLFPLAEGHKRRGICVVVSIQSEVRATQFQISYVISSETDSVTEPRMFCKLVNISDGSKVDLCIVRIYSFSLKCCDAAGWSGLDVDGDNADVY